MTKKFGPSSVLARSVGAGTLELNEDNVELDALALDNGKSEELDKPKLVEDESTVLDSLEVDEGESDELETLEDICVTKVDFDEEGAGSTTVMVTQSTTVSHSVMIEVIGAAKRARRRAQRRSTWVESIMKRVARRRGRRG